MNAKNWVLLLVLFLFFAFALGIVGRILNISGPWWAEMLYLVLAGFAGVALWESWEMISKGKD